ncbi:MAG: ComF family protein [Chitinophagaceae bacterium]|nr:ComF family protein [Chitinophagaceae bacterium]
MKKIATSIWNGLLDFIYPRLCLGCNKVLLQQESVLCIGCTEQLPHTHYHHIHDNATFQRLEGRFGIGHATSFGYYTKGGLLQYLLQELKYKGNKSVGTFLGKSLHAALRNVDWLAEAGLVVPVPLHRQKQKYRGFNQSALIGQELAAGRGLPFLAENLVRIVDTGTQTAKSRMQRVENMKNAFVVKDRPAFAQQHILLIDDILTTGATIEHCALALEEAGAAKISVVTVGLAV